MEAERLTEKILIILPLLRKKLINAFPACELTKQQFGLLFTISRDDKKPMSFYSEKMMVPKSNLTVMSDKLIEDGLIVREYDPADRRIVNLAITPKGERHLEKHKEAIKQQILQKIASLSDEDISRLNELMGEMQVILNKID